MPPPTPELPPFQRLVDESSAGLRAYLSRAVGPEAADDCLQETLLAALRGYPELRRPEAARGWLYAIARRKVVDHVRERGRAPIAVEPAVIDERSATAPADQPAIAATSQLGELVGALADGRRDAILLRFGADLSYREIGVALECSEAAARRRVADAMRDLRAWVDEHGIGIEELVA